MNKKLKIKIIESGRMQKEIAQKIDMHASKLSEIVQGWDSPTDEQKQKIAHELKCKVDDIF